VQTVSILTYIYFKGFTGPDCSVVVSTSSSSSPNTGSTGSTGTTTVPTSTTLSDHDILVNFIYSYVIKHFPYFNSIQVEEALNALLAAFSSVGPQCTCKSWLLIFCKLIVLKMKILLLEFTHADAKCWIPYDRRAFSKFVYLLFARKNPTILQFIYIFITTNSIGTLLLSYFL